MCWPAKARPRSPLKSDGRVKQMRKAGPSKSVTGVRCLWLFRRRGFPASEDFPLARISGDIATGFKAHLDEQAMPLDEFLDAVFARRFRYGIPVGAKAVVRIQSGVTGCWKCGVVMRIVTFIEVFVGPASFSALCLRPNGLSGPLGIVPRPHSEGVRRRRHQAEIQQDSRAELYEQWLQ
jgi:hypothetical protein